MAFFLRETLFLSPLINYKNGGICQSLYSFNFLGLEVEVLDEDAMGKLGMGALLGVGQGSRRDPHGSDELRRW